MINAYMNGNKLQIGESMPITQDQIGKDLNALHTTQNRFYQIPFSLVKKHGIKTLSFMANENVPPQRWSFLIQKLIKKGK